MSGTSSRSAEALRLPADLAVESDEASYVNGQDLIIDGGLVAVVA